MLNARIGFRLNGKSINQEWALDLQNLTNHENIYPELEQSAAASRNFIPNGIDADDDL